MCLVGVDSEFSQLFIVSRFCAIRGHWESLLILDPYHIENVVPMRPEHISECLRFHYTKKGEQLVDYNTGQMLLDIFGGKIANITQWSAPANLFIFKSALKALHDHHQHVECFEYECPECLKKYEESLKHQEQATGCGRHSPPKFFPKGNPILHETFKTECTHFKAISDGHIVNGCTPLLPSEVHKLYLNLSPCFQPFDVMIYTMVILAISLGLRFDELGSVKTDEFRCDMSLIYNNYIEFLALGVKGKRDKHVVNFQLHFEDEVPHLCPCRMLLIWIWFLDLQDGSCIFPSESDLEQHLNGKKSSSGTFFTYPITYYSLFTEVTKFFVDGLGIIGRFFGTHIFRKTFYLFGILGGADYESLKLTARHKHSSSADLVRKHEFCC